MSGPRGFIYCGQHETADRAYCAAHDEWDHCAMRAAVRQAIDDELGEPLVPADRAARMAAIRRQIQLQLRRFGPGDLG